jgi:hypothetical protein
MANEFVAKNGLISQNNTVVSGLLTITGSLIHGLEGNVATGDYSHAEGSITKAIGNYSHAEGDFTEAKGDYSHAEGQNTMTLVSAQYSHVEGNNTIAAANHQHVQGQWNTTSSIPAAFIVGNGTDDLNRSNLIYAHDSTVEITGSLQINGGVTGSLFGTATTASFIPTTNLTTLPTVVAFTAPVASITSGGSAAETTIQTLTVPGGVYKSGDNILLTVWGLRTTGAAAGVTSTLTTRITNISGTTIFASTTGNRNHNFTLTARVLSDTSILWYGGAVAAAAITTTVTSVSSSGFTLNFSVTRDLNTTEFTLYNAICRKYN